MFQSIFNSGISTEVSIFIIMAVSLALGTGFSLLCNYKSKSSKSFGIATAMLPMAVAVVIALVNGNIGVGVAIAGAFSLVRFRSAPGTAREIAIIFIAMASGLAFGIGYIAYGAIFLVVAGAILCGYSCYQNKNKVKHATEKILKITIPESLDYTEVFDDIFTKYLKECELEGVKSTNMGSMFRLSYRVTLHDARQEKKLLDEVRTRNGNLEVQCHRADLESLEL